MNDLPQAKKSLGQHWLSDEGALSSIVEAGQLGPDDVALEIGPGGGTLTRKLTEQTGEVLAIELDKSLVADLRKSAPANLQVVQGDILTFDLTALPAEYKVIANIPYYLTSHLIRILSESNNPPSRCVLLVQKEVAERVAAKPGDMSLLSVTAQFFWEVSLGQVVPKKLFTPPPKIDSQILILQRRTEPLFPSVEPKQFFRLVKAGFAARRKTLLNSLSVGLGVGKAETAELLAAAGIDPQTRPQELSLENWQEIYKRALPLLN